jgi:predicted transcriptional regulator
MTKLLNQAFERIAKLSPEAQDALAEHLIDLLDDKPVEFELTPAQEAALKKAIARADRGEFASQAEIDAVFRKYGA